MNIRQKLKTVTVGGRDYVDTRDLASFMRRAADDYRRNGLPAIAIAFEDLADQLDA